MYTLEFNDENKQKYDIIYEAFIGTKNKSLEDDAVTFIDVMRKFRTLGEVDEDILKKTKVRIYKYAKEGSISLSKAEFNCLKGIINSTPFAPWILDVALEIKEWLDGLKETPTK